MMSFITRYPLLAAKSIARRIGKIPTQGLPKVRRSLDDGFDQKHGVETFTIVRVVSTESPNVVHGIRYQPSPEELVLWSVANCGVCYANTTFIDVGCGKGRVLILAHRFPFKEIIGIEYSEALASIGRKNLVRLMMDDRCKIVVSDVVDYEFPGGDLLVYFYNPFDGHILRIVLEKLRLTSGRVRIVYIDPPKIVHSIPSILKLTDRYKGACLFDLVR